MKTMKFFLKGVTPLIQHADTLVDVLHPLAKEKSRLTNKKKNKTEDDIRRIDEIEFVSSLYMHETLGPIIPAANIDRMIQDAAKFTKQGKKVVMGMSASEDYFPLVYDGPRDVPGLWADKRFQFRKSIKQGQGRVMRVRPWFHGWSAEVSLMFDEKVFDEDAPLQFMQTAGRYVGLGDWRPRYGRFDVSVVK